MTGGLAKNNQVWTKSYNKSETDIVIIDEEKIALKDPNAKNYKPQYKNKKNSFDKKTKSGSIKRFSRK
nr:hypothetical protein [uncultured Carboxylicivirga sp.]